MRSCTLLFIAMLGCSGSTDTPSSADDAGSDDAPAETSLETSPVDESGATDSGTVDFGTHDDFFPDISPDTATGGTAGCMAAAIAPGVTDATIDVAGTKRTYQLSIPAGYDGKTPTPLAFGWHGRTGNGALFRAYSGVETSAGGKAIFVYADGLAVTANPKDTGWDLSATGRDLKLYDALYGDLTKRLCVDPKRVWSFGHSFGGYMSNFLGCQRGGKTVHAIAPFAGGLAGTSGCGAVPAWIAHAEDDPVVPFSEGTKAHDFWVGADGCKMTTKPTPPDPCVAHDGCAQPVVWCAAKTGGHNWPSFAAGGIWTFFSKL